MLSLFDCLLERLCAFLIISLFALSTSLSLSLFQMFVHVMISLFWLHEHFTFYFYYGSLQCNFIASLNPQLIPFSLSTLFKRDAVSFAFLSSYFQVSLPLRIGILSSQEGVALVLGRPQLNLIKFTASRQTFHCAERIYSLVYVHRSEIPADFLFRLFVNRLKRARRPGPNENALFIMFSCARLLENS